MQTTTADRLTTGLRIWLEGTEWLLAQAVNHPQHILSFELEWTGRGKRPIRLFVTAHFPNRAAIVATN